MEANLGSIGMLGWSPPEGEFSERDWIKAVQAVVAVHQNHQWALGDLWAYGEAKYGDRKAMTAAPGWQGPSFRACKNAACTARVFERSRRRDLLTFKHHAEVAALPPDQADELLDWAEKEHQSAGKLRKRIREMREAEAAESLIPKLPDAETTARVEEFISSKTIGEVTAWRLRRTLKVAPDLAREVLDGTRTAGRAYAMAVDRVKEREAALKAARESKSTVTGLNVVQIRSRSVEAALSDLAEGTATLRRVCDDRYSAETLRRAFGLAEARRVQADVRVILKFMSNLALTWESPALRMLDSHNLEKCN